jgi:hypothetical protein
MSGNERERMKIMAGVAEEEVTLIAASGLMGVTYRQGKRIWRRYQDEGDAGLAGKLPQTQFGRAMEALGIKLILANSPQAKGRVERMNGTLQDRLVKETRLAGINDLAGANRFLAGKYLRAFNRKFKRVAAQPLNAHRKNTQQLQAVLSWEVERVVQGDWTVACAGQRYQLDRGHEALSLVRRKVIVRTLRTGRVQLVYRGQPLKWRLLPAGSVRKKPQPVRRAKPAGPAGESQQRETINQGTFSPEL